VWDGGRDKRRGEEGKGGRLTSPTSYMWGGEKTLPIQKVTSFRREKRKPNANSDPKQRGTRVARSIPTLRDTKQKTQG